MNTESNDNSHESAARSKAGTAEGGYGAPAPEDEMPPAMAHAQEDGAERSTQTSHDSAVTPKDANASNEPTESGASNEPNELAEDAEGEDQTPIEAPSTDAPLEESNAGPTSSGRESFSSETDADAAGDPI